MPKSNVTFSNARQVRIFQDVVDQIQDAILNGLLKPGDYLPSERELKDQFNTSRGTLREALRVLEQKGLIRIQLGVNGGAVVQCPKTDNMVENLDMLIRFQKISLFHLAEFRENAEGAAAALAAGRITPGQAEKLNDLIQKCGEIVQKGLSNVDEFLDVDGRIHKEIAAVSGNPIYVIVHKMIHENIRKYYENFLPWTMERLEKNFSDLKLLVHAVVNNDAKSAECIAKDHVHKFNEMMTMEYEIKGQKPEESVA